MASLIVSSGSVGPELLEHPELLEACLDFAATVEQEDREKAMLDELRSRTRF